MRLNLTDCTPAYGFLDPHGGASDEKRHGSRSALVVGCRDMLGRVFVLHAWAGRVSTSMVMDKIERAVRDYALKVMGVEENGLVGLWTDSMRVNAQLRMKRLPLVKVPQPTNQEKKFRVKTILHPLISRNMLFLNPDDPGQIELRNEIVSFPMSTRMDMVDALASLVRSVIPPLITIQEQELRKDQALKYLRDSGATPRQIEYYLQQKGVRP